MGITYFISDVHLGMGKRDDELERERLLLEFLKHVGERGERLFIIGDFFDFWFEYRSVIPRKYFNVLVALKELSKKGISIKFVTGNHDFWMNDFFQSELQIEVFKKSFTTNINGKKFFIAHGDGLISNDLGQRITESILHNRYNIKLFKTLHPDIAFIIARFISGLSRKKERVANIEKYSQFAKRCFNDGYDCVVLAHTHFPDELHENGHAYINTGDWIDHFSYGEFDNCSLTVKYWKRG